MKCSKCGFISFDYLSTCKKCGTNLSQARSGLGFSDTMPSPPAFLKALVEDVSSTAGEGIRREAKAPAVSRPSSEAAPTPGDEISLGGLMADESLSVSLDDHEDTEQWAIDHSWLDELDEPAAAESLEDNRDLVLELIDDEATGEDSATDSYQKVSLDSGDDQGLPAWELQLDEGMEDMLLEDLPLETESTAALETEPEGSQAEYGQEAAETEFSLAEFDDDVDDLVLGLDDDEADLLTLVDDDLPTEKIKPQTGSEPG
jgi:hypothetical protein